jgi:hypothetical protein
VRVLCRDFVLEVVESSAVDWILLLALVGIVDGAEERPERRRRLLADEPGSGVASELQNARLEAAEFRFLAAFQRVDLAEDVLVALGLGDGVSVGAVNLQNRFDDLEN